MKKVLIINISGLGDIVASLSIANALVARGDSVDFLIRKAFASLFQDLLYQEYNEYKLPTEEYDIIIDVTSNNKSREITKRISAGIKIGRYKNLLQKIKNQFIYKRQVKKYSVDNNIISNHFPILKALQLDISEDVSLLFNEKIKLQSVEEVCIHIGAENKLRKIPLALIVELCFYFKKQGIGVRLIGIESDIASIVMKETNNYPIYETGTLAEVSKWLINSRLVIAPDSGIFHLASALQVPSIGLYGPNTSKRASGNYPNSKIIELEFDCRPCNQNKSCPYNIRCLNEITLKMLLTHINALEGRGWK